VGDKLLTTTDHPFVLMYRDVGVDRKWSLRSRKGGVDVSILAQRWAGNGHPSAAGFVTRINDDVVYYLEE
jgi:nanoRNase/pAp phosphatase (c-di-AMP/oligoRNAs hydrolase)